MAFQFDCPRSRLACFGGFCVLADSFALRGKLRREKCNMLQKSLVEYSIEGECWDEKGNFRREKCNMLQKSLAETVLRLREQ